MHVPGLYLYLLYTTKTKYLMHVDIIGLAAKVAAFELAFIQIKKDNPTLIIPSQAKIQEWTDEVLPKLKKKFEG